MRSWLTSFLILVLILLRWGQETLIRCCEILYYLDCLFQIALIASVLVASALANPAGPPSYHPAPAHGGYKIPPRPFAYAYGVSDEYSGTNFDKKETQVNKSFNLFLAHRLSNSISTCEYLPYFLN